jgi:protein-histidine N-methyltransferase
MAVAAQVAKVAALCARIESWQQQHQWESAKTLHAALTELMRLQRADAAAAIDQSASAQAEERWERFAEWLAAAGVDLSTYKFKLASSSIDSAGNGLVAVREIKAEELLMQIPQAAMLCTAVGRGADSPLARTLATDPMLSATPSASLAVLLLHERLQGSKSFFSPYIDVLPVAFSVPLCWSIDELAALQGTQVFSRALRGLRACAQQYCYIHALLQQQQQPVTGLPVSSFSYELYRWAFATVVTRQNRIYYRPTTAAAAAGDSTVEQLQDALALIPVYDMCNHAEGPMTTAFDSDERCLVMTAMQDFAAGAEVTMFYGKRPNRELLLYSGFVVPDSQHDSLPLDAAAALKAADPLCKLKLSLLQKAGVSASAELCIDSSGAPSAQLLSFLRIAVADKAEVGGLLRGGTAAAAAVISERNEAAVRSELLLSARKQLLALETTSCTADNETEQHSCISNDSNSSSSSSNARHLQLAAQMRACEAQLLHRCIHRLRQQIDSSTVASS